LIVDDDADAGETLRALLERWGHDVAVAKNGEEGIELTLATRPEVVLLHIGMPGLDGYRVAERIRAAPDGDRPFIIAVTGWTRIEDHRKARDAGFDTYVLKPVDPDHLRALLTAAPADGIPRNPPLGVRMPHEDGERLRRRSLGRILGVRAMNRQHRHQLLLVDDDSDFCETTLAVLRHAGHHAVAAYNGREALDLLHQGFRPCVILLDLGMPEMDGFVFRRLQLADPEIAAIPVFVVSAADDVTEADAKRAGMDVFYRKPVDLSALIATVAEYCSQAA
jgi:CheY-like chemotaxis protein